MSTLNRRTLVAAAAALPAVAIPAGAATPALASGAVEDAADRELIGLAGRLRQLWLEFNRVHDESAPIWEARRREIDKLPHMPLPELLAAHVRIEKAFPGPARNCDDIVDSMAPIMERIMALPATTARGLAAKALVAHFTCSHFWEESDERADLPELHTRQLIEAVERMAGVQAPPLRD